MQIKHWHLMLLNMEYIADVLVLIAGSDDFLEIIKEGRLS
jgi:hypothetical protein